jgi:hypothetical protein
VLNRLPVFLGNLPVFGKKQGNLERKLVDRGLTFESRDRKVEVRNPIRRSCREVSKSSALISPLTSRPSALSDRIIAAKSMENVVPAFQSQEHAAVAPRDCKSCWQKGLLVYIGRTSSIMGCCRWYSLIRGRRPAAQGRCPARARSGRALESCNEIILECGRPIATRHGLTEKQVDMILAGGLINWHRKQRTA